MPRNALRSSLRNKSGRTPQPERVARAVPRIGRQSLIERRDLCMSEIVRLSSDANAASSFLNKARQLLTRHWWSSSWRARADVLRTAEWLVGLGRKGAANNDSGTIALRS